jgi:hypothetical protein
VIEDAGLECAGLHWLLAKTEGFHLTHPDAAVRKKTGEYLVELAKFCADLGGNIMIFGSPKQRDLLEGVSRDQGMAYAAEVFKGAMPALEKLGVTLALEPLGNKETNFLPFAADAVELAEMVDSPHCKIMLDCKAMIHEADPIPELDPEVQVLDDPFPRQRPEPPRSRHGRSGFRADLPGAGRNEVQRLGFGRGVRLHPRRRSVGQGEHRLYEAMRGQAEPVGTPRSSAALRWKEAAMTRLEAFGLLIALTWAHAAAAAAELPSDQRVTNSLGMQLIRIEPGEFLMGSAPEPPRDKKSGRHARRTSRRRTA